MSVVIPAKAGIQPESSELSLNRSGWTPASAGVTASVFNLVAHLPPPFNLFLMPVSIPTRRVRRDDEGA